MSGFPENGQGITSSGQPQETAGPDSAFSTQGQYWAGDTGSLTLHARRAFLQLVRGPYLSSDRSQELWKALLNNQEVIQTRLSELFLDLVIDHELEIAFVRNAPAEEADLPKAVKSQPLTLADSIMVLSLRRELLTNPSSRVIIGREEAIEQLMHYRPVAQLDESAFKKRLEGSWSRLVKSGILQPLKSEERCEISPVLKLIFGIEEVKGIQKEYDTLLEELNEAGGQAGATQGQQQQDESEDAST